MNLRKILLFSLSTFFIASNAYSAEVGIEEIVVTAEKRESSLQDTAIAISAVSGDFLENRGIDDLSNLQSLIPNFHVGQEQDGFKVALRGVGMQGTTTITDPGVAFYMDNAYVPRPTGGSAIFYDIDRIEVLRGPQGTLYGRNATGGVINVIAKKPEEELGGRIGVSAGEYSLVEGRGVLNLPISDNVLTRFSAVYTEEDGYMENLSTAPGTQDLNGTEGDTTVRGQALFLGEGDLEVLVSVTSTEVNGTGIPFQFLERNPGGPSAGLLAGVQVNTDPLVIDNNAAAYNDTDLLSSFVRVENTYDGFDLFVQLGALTVDTDTLTDADGSGVDAVTFTKTSENDSESLEVRFASNGDGDLTWLAGLYYFSEETHILRHLPVNAGPPFAPFAIPPFTLNEFGESETLGVFASTTYSINDTLRLTTGIRQTEDEKSGSNIISSFLGMPLPPPIVGAEEDFSQTTWKIGLEKDTDAGSLLYANLSTGYKAGGFNISGDGSPYDAEELTAFEVGMKSNPLDGRAQVNVDVFFYDYEDLQLSGLGLSPMGAPQQEIVNATSTEIYGIEFDGKYEVSDNLLLAFGYSYISAEFEEFMNVEDDRANAPGTQDLTGNTVPFVAENTVTLGVDYGFELAGDATLVLSLNSTWHDEFFLREFNDPVIDAVDSNSKTDIALTYATGALSVTAYATNLEDETEKNNITVSPGFLGAAGVANYSKPLSYGIKVDYEF